MKKISLFLFTMAIYLFSACHNGIWDAIDDLDVRVTKLEELCKEMNTNIVSIQTIVNVFQAGDYITSIVEVKKDGQVIGYTITFGKHEPITIYHGENGKDGQDGSSSTPVIGVAKDTDGVYYWTLNGEWLLDDNGNKFPVSGTNGKDGQDGSNGQDGTDGKDGQDGADGKDGVTPQLKIEDGYWYISYDNGATWTQLGKATGEDGKDGQNGTNGKDGQDGDSMFQSVTQDDNYVYFTLADGTVIKIAKGSTSSENRIEGQLSGIFSVSRYDKINFSQGNLLYNPALDTWRFAEQQYKLYKKNPTNVTQNSNLWMDLLPWGSTWYRGVSPLETIYKDNEGYEFLDHKQVSVNIDNFDWGIYCRIENGGNKKNMWRTLSSAEWLYLIGERKNASQLYVKGFVDNISGHILLPDTSTIALRDPNVLVDGLKYSSDIWKERFEKQGCVFIPENNYWTSDPWYQSDYYNSNCEKIICRGQYVDFTTLKVNIIQYRNAPYPDTGYYTDEFHYIRLVRNYN